MTTYSLLVNETYEELDEKVAYDRFQNLFNITFVGVYITTFIMER